jgi:hypothetical protein
LGSPDFTDNDLNRPYSNSSDPVKVTVAKAVQE